MRTAVSLLSVWKLNAPGIIESNEPAPSLDKGDYSGDLRDFRNRIKRASG
jgi:hypothetical protein